MVGQQFKQEAFIQQFLGLQRHRASGVLSSGVRPLYELTSCFIFFRLVPKPNCVKVPKEICVNTKSNPRRVKKPVVKQWCYNPKDLNDLRASNIVPNEVTR